MQTLRGVKDKSKKRYVSEALKLIAYSHIFEPLIFLNFIEKQGQSKSPYLLLALETLFLDVPY